MNVTAIASRPRTSTGPPFERLYAVEPDGVAQIIPSHGDGAEVLAADRPGELDHAAERRARRDDVVDRDVALAVELAPRASAARRRRTRRRRRARRSRSSSSGVDRREEADAAEVDADHGHVAAEELGERAQHRAVAAERDDEVGVARGVVDELDTPAALGDRAHARDRRVRRRAAVRDDRGGLTGRDRCVDSLVEVIGKRRVVGLREVEEELPVALRPGKPGVYDADDARPPAERRLGDLAHARARAPRGRGRRRPCRRRRGRPRTAASRGRPPASPGAASASAGGSAVRREMNETSQTTSCGANGSSVSVARVRPLEHDDARVVAQPRVRAGRSRRRARSRAPRRAAAGTSVKPPVDAPTSRQSSPRGSTPSASSPCASFSPPRETYGGGRARRSSSASSSTCWPGLS